MKYPAVLTTSALVIATAVGLTGCSSTQSGSEKPTSHESSSPNLQPSLSMTHAAPHPPVSVRPWRLTERAPVMATRWK